MVHLPSTTPGYQSHGPLRKPKRVHWNRLETGDCFKGVTQQSMSTITRVDCRTSHQGEVIGRFELAGGSRYPGDAAVRAASDTRCRVYFARYVGVDWDSSAYDYTSVTPTPSSWRLGNHEVICVAVDPDHPDDSTISLRNVKE